MCQQTDEFAAPTSVPSESHYHYNEFQDSYVGPGQLVTKNVYVHVPPGEQSLPTYDNPVPRKHYNIIFIKGNLNKP